ncbi:alpha-glucosidase [Halomicroarcula sp. GCM10025709]|uniref:glycoside hydrolase family 13 protein n=1 Tax=Haloarcula TaxID=2237 RepID=UPI0024C23EF0|nr:alpha-glucosidase [Halomicroarcula sp. YJ-61-S]
MTTQTETDRTWWKEAVVYQIYPRSFLDTTGDGVGDLQGVAERVDYLDELGVDVVWLCPVYESPQADMGYDVSDYRAIDSLFGTMADWEDLRDTLHDRDIRLVMDQVVNHTSDEHDWFQASRSSADDSKRDWYHWHPGQAVSEAESPTDGTDSPGPPDRVPPNNWESFMGGSAWEWDDRTEAYYLHTYHTKQPDLNWANPDVREAIYEMLRWWLEKGIDGFRLDVVNHLSKPEGYPDGSTDYDWVGTDQFLNGPRIHEYCRELSAEVLSEYDAMTIGEMPGIDPDQAASYSADGLDMTFQFEHMSLDYGADGRWDRSEWALTDLKAVVSKWQRELQGEAWNALYLGNHDQARIVSRFGDDGEYREESAKLLATFLLTLRGTPHVYQGDEIGMTNADFASLAETRDPDTINHVSALMAERDEPYEAFRELVNARSRDNARTPVQWDDSDHAGFTDGDPWIGVTDNYTEINVDSARRDPGSVWAHYRELLELRADTDALVYGEYELLLPDDPNLYVYRRTLGEKRLLVVLNWSSERVPFTVPDVVSVDDASLLISNYGETPPTPADLTLSPYEACVYDLG